MVHIENHHRCRQLIVWVTLYSGVLNSSFALGNRQQHPPSQGGAGAPVLVVMETEASPGSLEPLNLGPHAEPPSRAELVMKALAVGYPDRVGPAVYRDGDWAVPIRGDFYYYAGGRLLPERLRNQEADYDPQPFYTYPAALPPWKPPGQEEAARFKTQAERRSRNPPKRSQHFFDALWRAHTKAEAYDRVKTIRFLGRNMLVHYAIMEELALVEERINAEAQTNTLVRQWMHNLDTITAWNWRGIADTQSRSFHAYGAAIDLLPKSQRGLQTYWLWTSQAYPEWWAVPYEKRLHPPEAVIKAFEDYGFVWGGKWLFFDTMHFEYRPEILILSGLPLTDLR